MGAYTHIQCGNPTLSKSTNENLLEALDLMCSDVIGQGEASSAYSETCELTWSDVDIQRVNVVQQLQSGRGKPFAVR